jgi:predicted DNA-binding antitoxin AbrB/MazE fold protein
MSKHVVDAIYQDGAFRLVGAYPLNLEEGRRVQLVIDDAKPNGAKKDVLVLAAQVYAGLSKEEVLDIERIATDRSRFFSHGR